jgi:ribosomal protein S12
MKSQDAAEPQLKVAIERDQDGERLTGCAVRQPKAMIAVGITDHDMAAVRGIAVGDDGRQRYRVERADVDEARRRGDENDRIRDKFGPP